jgi:hypothetical protein
MIWVLVAVLIFAELAVLGRIRIALSDGVVPLNPVSWFGYSEFLDLAVERKNAPLAYWLILLAVTALALVFGLFIFLVATS